MRWRRKFRARASGNPGDAHGPPDGDHRAFGEPNRKRFTHFLTDIFIIAITNADTDRDADERTDGNADERTDGDAYSDDIERFHLADPQ